MRFIAVGRTRFTSEYFSEERHYKEAGYEADKEISDHVPYPAVPVRHNDNLNTFDTAEHIQAGEGAVQPAVAERNASDRK